MMTPRAGIMQLHPSSSCSRSAPVARSIVGRREGGVWLAAGVYDDDRRWEGGCARYIARVVLILGLLWAVALR
eukprot:SAG25_NODE_2361_length_1681_cov_1.463970_3_plen_73_part_00